MSATKSFLSFIQLYWAIKAAKSKTTTDDFTIIIPTALKMVELDSIAKSKSKVDLNKYLSSNDIVQRTLAKLRLEELGEVAQRVSVGKENWLDKNQDQENLRIKKYIRKTTLETIGKHPSNFQKGTREYLEAVKRSDILYALMEDFYHGRLDSNIAINSSSELEKEAAILFLKDVDALAQIKAYGVEGYTSSVEKQHKEAEEKRRHAEIYGVEESEDDDDD